MIESGRVKSRLKIIIQLNNRFFQKKNGGEIEIHCLVARCAIGFFDISSRVFYLLEIVVNRFVKITFASTAMGFREAE